MTARTYTSNHVKELRPKKHYHKKPTRNKWMLQTTMVIQQPKFGNRTQLQITNEVTSNRIIYTSEIEDKRA